MNDPGNHGPVVVKLGGSLLEDSARRAAALDALAARVRVAPSHQRQDGPLVLVHGGGRHVDAWLGRLGIPRRMHQGIRVTDAPTLDTVVAVLSGLVNSMLVAELAARGVEAFGFSGIDGRLLEAAPMDPAPEPGGAVDFGHVGQIARANARPVRALIGAGYVPVIASLALGPGSRVLNVNADAAASAIAAALEARRLVFLTDVEGLLDPRGHRVRRLSAARARDLLQGAAVSGGMRPKLHACLDALESGVGQVLIAGPAAQQRALLRGQGGTRLVAA
ncbi:MAG: acetylglutamate kinase [Candidatus Polarisedimenticolia bacterium]